MTALLLAIALSVSAPPPYTAKCVGVHDGDTITVRMISDAAGRPAGDAGAIDRKIRAAEIDAPESKQASGPESQANLSRFAINRTLWIEPVSVDRYGRTVAHIFLIQPNGRIWLNAQQIRDGHAWQYLAYSKSPELKKLEAEARKAKRGLWAKPKPQPPWEFRHPKK